MWLFSKSGFVSIVAHREQTDKLLVRGRFKEDIDNIRDLLAAGGEVVSPFEDRGADYRYRLVCSRVACAQIIAGLVESIDYDNFKSAVHGDPIRDRAYMGCWSAMSAAQVASRE